MKKPHGRNSAPHKTIAIAAVDFDEQLTRATKRFNAFLLRLRRDGIHESVIAYNLIGLGESSKKWVKERMKQMESKGIITNKK